MHDPLLYEARRSRLLFVVLVTGLGLVAFVAQGSSAGEAEPREPRPCDHVGAGAAPAARTDRSSSTTTAAEVEAPATMLVQRRARDDHHGAADDGAAHHRGAPARTRAVDHQRRRPPRRPRRAAPRNAQTGTATWYEGGTASGCAHLTLPKGTVVTVTAISSGRQVTCTVDDRGPFGSHIIDLSPSGFQALAPLSTGVVSVRITW